MSASRVALLITCVIVAGFGGWFAASRWEDTNRVASVVSALAAVAAVGVAVWAAVRTGKVKTSVTVTKTGKGTARQRGQANTGVQGSLAGAADTLRVTDSGDATASGDSTANTGVKWD